MSRLELFLFGSPRLLQGDQTLEVDARKSMAMLAYLAVTNKSHSRETLLALLWPQLTPRRAQNVLRRNLSTLNKTLDGQWLNVNRDTISLNEDTSAWVDVVHFRHLTQGQQNHHHSSPELCPDCLIDLTKAVDLYHADFLTGFGVRSSPNFDTWQSLESEQLKCELSTVLQRLVDAHTVRREYDQAINYAQRWSILDPLHEALHRRLMELYAEKGDRSAALRQYQHCVQLLDEELGVVPEAETTDLYEKLQHETETHQKTVGETFAIVDGDTEADRKQNLLGTGSMGTVYRGHNTQTGETVAIKVLKPEFVTTNLEIVERFVREGEILRWLNHPNIVKFLAASEHEDQYFLVMEYVGGGTLQDLIVEEGPLSSSRTVEIALDIADALTRAHHLDIVHRDLKPANILMAKDGSPRLSDFGIARLADRPQLTKTNQIMGTINYLSPEGINGQPLDELADIWAFGVMLFEMLTGEQPFKGETLSNTLTAILHQPVPRLLHDRTNISPPLVDLIERMLQKDPVQRIPSVRLVGAELEAIIANRPITPPDRNPVTGPPPLCPYRGLFAFQEEDAAYFFGREAFTRRLVGVVQQQALAAVLGPSGCGKSSVVFAGLLPQLRPQPNWTIVAFRPGSDPFHSLAAALLPSLEPTLSETDRLVGTRKLAQGLSEGELLLEDVVGRILQKNGEANRILLVADQFEELYALCSQPEIRHTFLDVLLDIIELQPFRRNPNFTFVPTLRADFLEQALAYRPLADAVQDATLMLGPMDREELPRAIEEPAAKQGVVFEAGLVERILDDVGEEAGNLPLLEFALTLLWEQQKNRELSHESYDEIGGVAGALTRHADHSFNALKPVEQEAVRRILIQLVKPGEGTEDSRRIAYKDELDEDDWALVQRLADARLVITGLNSEGIQTVEVVHEALIRNWQHLREWMAADRIFRVWQERLRAAVIQWQAAGEDEGALLRGIPLAEAEGRLEERVQHLSQIEQHFIRASIASRERKNTERERERQVRERLRQRIAGGAIAGLIIALSLALLAGVQWRQAAQDRQTALEAQAIAAAERDQAQLALSRQLAALTVTQLEERLDLALLLSVEATYIADTGEARSILRTALTSNPHLLMYFWGHTDRVTGVAFSPDGRMLATSSNDDTIRLWDVATGQSRGSPLNGHTGNVLTVAFSPDGETLASAGAGNTIMLWDVADGQPRGLPLTGHTSSVSSIMFSPDGQTLASTGDRTVMLWDLTSNPPHGNALTGHIEAVRSVAFSPNGHTLATGSNDGTVILWDVTTGEPLGPALTGHEDWVRSLAFSPDGRTLASAGEDGVIILRDIADASSIIHTLHGHTNSVRSISFSPIIQESTGSYILASGSTDGTIILWDTESGQPIGSPLTGHTDWVRSVAFSPDGQTLASASHDMSIILWDISDKVLDVLALGSPLTGHTESVRSIAFNPDGQILASGSEDETVILWDVAKGVPIDQPLTGHEGSVRSVTFSPNGRTLATGGDDGNIILWDVANGVSVSQSLNGHAESVRSVAFSPDGQTLAAGSNDGTISLWDVAGGTLLGAALAGHEGGVQSVAFSPDGQTLASAGDDKRIILWDISNGAQLDSILTGHDDVVFSLVFSPDGQTLTSGSWDNTIILWDVESGEPLAPLPNLHTDSVQSVAFSPDGQILASGSWDKTIILWDSLGKQPLGPPIRGHTGSVRAVAFSADGQTLASAGDDGVVLLWDVSLESWRDRACRRANRNLSAGEWQQFFGDQSYRPTCPDLPQLQK